MTIAERDIDTETGVGTQARTGPLIDDALVAMAARIQRSTVQVRGRGPGGGSGVIWSPDGLVITNAHVARGRTATVELSDGRTFDATLVARDPRRDLAALRAPATDLPALPVGDSDALRVGGLVLAVGNPLGIVGAMTAGIVHAIGEADEDTPLAPDVPRQQRWVQADVRLAPGNSGGPLTDAEGRVIGINSMINGGLALAVPSNDVTRFLRLLGQRPHLGVVTQPVVLPVPGGRIPGLVVLEATMGSPAEGAGLIPGDILIGADGALFRRPDDLIEALYQVGVGATLRLEMVRGGQRTSREVTLGGVTPEVETEEAA